MFCSSTLAILQIDINVVSFQDPRVEGGSGDETNINVKSHVPVVY